MIPVTYRAFFRDRADAEVCAARLGDEYLIEVARADPDDPDHYAAYGLACRAWRWQGRSGCPSVDWMLAAACPASDQDELHARHAGFDALVEEHGGFPAGRWTPIEAEV